MQSPRPPRPIGITILAILDILSGIGVLLLGVAIAAFSALFASSTLFGAASGTVIGLGAIIGGVVAIIGLIYLAVGFGFLNGKGWAWSLAMFLNVLAILGSIGLTVLGDYTSIVGVIFYGFMTWYFTRPRVKAFFGKGTMFTTPAFSTGYAPSAGFSTPTTPNYLPQAPSTSIGSTPTLSTLSSPPAGTTRTATPTLSRFCTNCGAMITAGSTKCGSCGQTA